MLPQSSFSVDWSDNMEDEWLTALRRYPHMNIPSVCVLVISLFSRGEMNRLGCMGEKSQRRLLLMLISQHLDPYVKHGSKITWSLKIHRVSEYHLKSHPGYPNVCYNNIICYFFLYIYYYISSISRKTENYT